MKVSPAPWSAKYLRGNSYTYGNQWNIEDADGNAVGGIKNKDDAVLASYAPELLELLVDFKENPDMSIPLQKRIDRRREIEKIVTKIKKGIPNG